MNKISQNIIKKLGKVRGGNYKEVLTCTTRKMFFYDKSRKINMLGEIDKILSLGHGGIMTGTEGKDYSYIKTELPSSFFGRNLWMKGFNIPCINIIPGRYQFCVNGIDLVPDQRSLDLLKETVLIREYFPRIEIIRMRQIESRDYREYKQIIESDQPNLDSPIKTIVIPCDESRQIYPIIIEALNFM